MEAENGKQNRGGWGRIQGDRWGTPLSAPPPDRGGIGGMKVLGLGQNGLQTRRPACACTHLSATGRPKMPSDIAPEGGSHRACTRHAPKEKKG